MPFLSSQESKKEKDQEIVDSGSESASIEQVTEPEQRSEPDVDSKVDESAEFSSVSHDHCYTSLKGEMCDSCADKRNTIRQLQARIQQLESQNKKLLEKTEKKEKINFVDICLKSDKKVKTYTGIPNKSVFEALLNHVSSKAKSIRYWCGSMKVLSSKVPRKFKKTPEKSGPQRKLTVKEELTLLLLKLRMAIKNVMLADLFSISVCTTSQIINTWAKFLAKELKALRDNTQKYQTKFSESGHGPKQSPLQIYTVGRLL